VHHHGGLQPEKIRAVYYMMVYIGVVSFLRHHESIAYGTLYLTPPVYALLFWGELVRFRFSLESERRSSLIDYPNYYHNATLIICSGIHRPTGSLPFLVLVSTGCIWSLVISS